MGDAREWLDGTQFDGVMNYLFAGPTIAFTAGDRVILEQVEGRAYQCHPALDAPSYAEKIQHLLALYPWSIQLGQLNLLASHDTARLLTIAGGDRTTIELATLLLLTFPGAPSIYYGDEVGLPGGTDPDSRRGFPLEENWDREILDFHRQLIALRHRYPALRSGEYQLLSAAGLVYVFGRTLAEEKLIVAVNIGTDDAKIKLHLDNWQLHPSKLLFGKAEITWQTTETASQLTLALPARSGSIIGT